MMAGKVINLVPEFDLLNSDFNGYKFSPDVDVSTYFKNLEEGVWEEKPAEPGSYLHTRQQALQNHIYNDSTNSQHVYHFSSRGHLVKHMYSHDFRLSNGEVVWQADMQNDIIKTDSSSTSENDKDDQFGCLPPSVCFPSADLAVTSNGRGKLCVLKTGDRSITQSWLESCVFDTTAGLVVHSCIQSTEDVASELDVLVLSLVTPEALQSDPLYVAISDRLRTTTASALHLLTWLTYKAKGKEWEKTRERRLSGLGSLEYCALNEASTKVILLSHDHYEFIYDSQHPLVAKETSNSNKSQSNDATEKKSKYIYMQNNEEMMLWLGVGTNKDAVKIEVKAQNLKVSLNDSIVLEGQLMQPVDCAATTWTFKDTGEVEIVMPKLLEDLSWERLFEGSNDGGEEIFDQAYVEEVHQKLAHLTSDTWDANPESSKPAFNPGQLEACDEASEDLLLLILDGKSHAVTHHASLGATQHLFNVQNEGKTVPAFCLRHDVDGIVWQPDNLDDKFYHSSTFHAFGYVRASKTMAKFTRAATDNSYVAVCELKSHLYVFCQPDLFGGELKNRKTGKMTNSIARQLVISLKNHDDVLGIHTSPCGIFILTRKQLFVYCIQDK